MAAAQLPEVLSTAIERCAGALGDVPRLKTEVVRLKATGEGLAHFASALFELELAREGDPECRNQLSHLAEVLLVFWRDGSGDTLARLHPAMQSLWLSVAPMLVQFESRQFDHALTKCWKHRAEPSLLLRDIDELQPAGNKRVEFATCIYQLELARHGVDGSRAQFAKRAGLLAEAYQDAQVANELIGHDAGLLHLWGELKPYLDEFFEGLEEAAARAQDSTRKVQMPTQPAMPAVPAEGRPALGSQREVPSFRSLVNKGKPLASPPVAKPPGMKPKPSAPAARPPPPPPQNLTPPGGWVPDADVMIEEVAPPAPPPPPANMTPPGSWKPPRSPSGEVELVEAIDDVQIDEAPPPPPPITPARGLAAAIAQAEDLDVDFEPDDATLGFWEYTFASLQMAPGEGQTRARMLASESRTDRKRLTTWLDGLGPHLPVPEAQAFGALVRLMLAAETKEKSLFGQANPRRKEALEAAFGMLQNNPAAAGHAAVWFELDGPETRQALDRGLELLITFLAFCARNELDPLQPVAVQKYLAS